MDEPLANLDYKLREELRIEIPKLFEASGSIFVYATTEPEEALLLGGNTAALWEGRVTQFGSAMDVYRTPGDATTAQVYSDPPMNFVSVQKKGSVVRYPNGQSTKADDRMAGLPDGEYRAGFRAHHLEIGSGDADAIKFEAKLIVTELTGSDTFVHLDAEGSRWIGLVPGLQDFKIAQTLEISLSPANVFYFDQKEKLVTVPAQQFETAAFCLMTGT